MQSRLTTVILSVLFMLIISVFGLFGIILWNSFLKLETSAEPEEIKTIISETEETIDKDIKAPDIIENPFSGIIDNEKQTQPQNENEDYSNKGIDKYFYNQLENESKIIYNAFEKNKENMKTGNYKIELGSTFSFVLSQEDGQDLLGKYYQSAIEAYTYDNPDVFYLSPNKMYLNIETTTRKNNVTYYVYVNSGPKANYFIDEFSSQEQINNAITKIEQVKDIILQNKTNNTYKNIKMVHDYLIKNVKYDTSVSKENIYNIYGAMVNQECVCEGYARSFKYMMDEMRNPMHISYRKSKKLRRKSRKSCMELC